MLSNIHMWHLIGIFVAGTYMVEALKINTTVCILSNVFSNGESKCRLQLQCKGTFICNVARICQ